MQFTQTFFIIKPDGVEHLDTILKELTNLGVITRLDRMQTAPRHLLEEHYTNIKDKPFYDETLRYMQSGPIYLGILSSPYADITKRLRVIVGDTFPSKADPESLRGRFGKEHGDVVENVIHASDSDDTADDEIRLWFPKIN
jgi:nucleoside diphosphate kinase